MPAAPPTTVEDMFVQTASGVQTDGRTMTLLGLTPHTIYFSDRPERIVGHLTTHRFLQWWSEGSAGGCNDRCPGTGTGSTAPPLGRMTEAEYARSVADPDIGGQHALR
jgi:hypothetical protein